MDFEIKLNIGASGIEQAMHVFDLDPGTAKDRKIWFGEILTGFDGRGALPLLGRGVILRVRAKRNSGEVTLKLRGPDGCLDVQAWTDHVVGLAAEAKIEGDWADRRLVSASLTAKSEGAGSDALEAGHPRIGDLMSPEQRDLARELLIPYDEAELLGPVTTRKWDPESGIAAELWAVDELRFLEISVVSGDDPEGAQRGLEKRARDAGLVPDDGQEPKTTRVLRHLAQRPR